MNNKELHDAIMRLPCNPLYTEDTNKIAYKVGHRDARHAAAELVAAAEAATSPAPAVVQMTDGQILQAATESGIYTKNFAGNTFDPCKLIPFARAILSASGVKP
jgi:hypothetical protein